ncbi:MAG: lipopolysaccharide biosynthesis protein, partial [Bacteroidales bacterium]|nr:lipopolysaccharide biosynthesis protein [Bacteroidales bacterium]
WSHLPWMSWYDEADNVKYIFYINLFCTAIVTLGFFKELKDFRLSDFSVSLLKQMLKYTWPLLLLGIVGNFNQTADKILLPWLLPGEEGHVQLGIYGACVKIAMLMALITQAFRYAYEPFVFGGQHDKQSKETQAQATKYFVMFTLLAFLAVMCYIDVIQYFIGGDYREALPAVPIVMMAEILMGIYFNLSFWYKLNGQTWWGAVMSAIGCVVLVATNIVFVPRIGYMACAWGGLAGYGVCVLLSYFIGQKKNPVPYPVGTLLGYFVLTLALYAVMQVVHPDALWLRLVVNTLLLGVYVAVVAWNERALLRPIVNRIKHLRK